MEELQVIETTSGRQFKPWASKEDVQAIKQETVQAVVQAVQDPASVTAIASEIASGKQKLAAKINELGGDVQPTDSFDTLIAALDDFTSLIDIQGITLSDRANLLDLMCNSDSLQQDKIITIDDDSVTYLDKTRTFRKCHNLKSVRFANLVTIDTGNYTVFGECTSLTNVEMPSLQYLYGGGFSGCTSLEVLYFPALLYCLNSSVFSGCTSLKIFKAPLCNAVGMYEGFSGCTSLQYLEFGTLTQFSPGLPNLANLRSFKIGADTNININLSMWTATNVIAEGMAGIYELNANIMADIVPNLKQDGGRIIRLGTGLYDVLTTETKDALTDRGWTLQRG